MKNYLLLVISALFLTNCSEKTQEKPGKPSIVCTVGMIADVTKNIVGDHYEVSSIIGEGADPHVYKHTAGDIKRVKNADLIFFNGIHLEGKFSDVLHGMKEKGQPVFAIGEAVTSDENLLKDEEGSHDPHLWMDVKLWSKVATVICDTLCEAKPDLAAEFQSNHDAYQVKLTTLDEYCAKSLKTIPKKKRTLITAHDAFGYMESAYGIKVKGIQGISTESEAGLKHIEQLITFIVKKKISAVFVEKSVNDKNVKALIEGAKAKGHEVIIGGELFSDAMGAKGTPEGTYLGMIDHNVTTITNALGGKAEGCFKDH